MNKITVVGMLDIYNIIVSNNNRNVLSDWHLLVLDIKIG